MRGWKTSKELRSTRPSLVPCVVVGLLSSFLLPMLQVQASAAAQPSPLTGVVSLVGSGTTYCALLNSSRVECWGQGVVGSLGDGNFYGEGDGGNPAAVQVLGVGGVGSLSGVVSVAASGSNEFCAALSSGGVDCWGKIGGQVSGGNATPVPVAGVGGIGTLSGVASVQGDVDGFCALLQSGGVDCWGTGIGGILGDGTAATQSSTPVQVVGVGGVGTLSGVQSIEGGSNAICAVLTSGGVDCWGAGTYGQLGDGTFYTTGIKGSSTPVQVLGVGGVGTLTNVVSVNGESNFGFCALLTSTGLDCWGLSTGSAVPSQVPGVGGVGTLSGVASISSYDSGGYCAVLSSGGVDCWGKGSQGQLGSGTFNDSSAPVQVLGIGGSGTLTGATSVESSDTGVCALLSTNGVACWGGGSFGQLGDGSFSGSPAPVQVLDPEGSGALAGIASIVTASHGVGFVNYCATTSSGQVDCWGNGYYGILGDGNFYRTGNNGTALPVAVIQSSGAPILTSESETPLLCVPGPDCQPVVVCGTSATLSASASGIPAPSVVWQKSTYPYQAWVNIPGATAPIYPTGPLTVSENGTEIRALFSNGAGSTTSDTATLECIPSASIIIPSTGANVSSQQQLDALASAGATTVRYALTGGAYSNRVVATGSPTIFGWLATWNTTTVPNGSYTLTALSTYPDGESATSPPVAINVSNAAPGVSVVFPSPATTQSGRSALLDATTSSNVTSVQYVLTSGSLDNSVIATTTSPTLYGWLATWDTTRVANGSYNLQAISSYAGGVTGTSAPVMITVNNPPPTSGVGIPANGTTVKGSRLLDASASPGVTELHYVLTGGTLASVTVATGAATVVGWLAIWDSTTVANGTYTLQTVASYAGGVSGTSPPITITVAN